MIEKELKNNILQISVIRITALWAFSESALGGILHAFSIPLRGMLISSFAVIFITLIGLISDNNKQILKSTLIVILIKALVSPHSQITAYLAVFIQGLLGNILFLSKKAFRLSALLLGISAVLFSGIQKIIILTIVFGNTLWKSLDIFIHQLLKDFFNLNTIWNYNFGYLIIFIYLFFHIIIGIIVGIYAGLLPQKIITLSKNELLNKFDNSIPESLNSDHKTKKKKFWLLKPVSIVILIILISLIAISYMAPTEIAMPNYEIIFMIFRSIFITLTWYLVFFPFVKKYFRKFTSDKKRIYTKEVDEILKLFPEFKKILFFCWSNSSNQKGIRRIYSFISDSFYLLLIK